MPDQPSPDVELLPAAYAAFNARDIDAVLATMAPDVLWPKAFKGGFAHGHQEVRAYWTEQWSEIDPRVEPVSFTPEAGGRILVRVHQVVRDLAGAVIADGQVGHRFTIEAGSIRAMELCARFRRPSSVGSGGGGAVPQLLSGIDPRGRRGALARPTLCLTPLPPLLK